MPPGHLLRFLRELADDLVQVEPLEVRVAQLGKREVVLDDLVEALFEILLDPGDGRDFSNSFIRSDVYGTRAATVVLVERDGATYFEERNFGPMGQPQSGRQFKFSGHVGA